MTGRRGAPSIRSIITRRAVDAALPVACQGTRSGSTPPQSLAAAGAGLVELQGSGRLAGAHHAGALRAAPARGAVAKLRYQAAR